MTAPKKPICLDCAGVGERVSRLLTLKEAHYGTGERHQASGHLKHVRGYQWVPSDFLHKCETCGGTGELQPESVCLNCGAIETTASAHVVGELHIVVEGAPVTVYACRCCRRLFLETG